MRVWAGGSYRKSRFAGAGDGSKPQKDKMTDCEYEGLWPTCIQLSFGNNSVRGLGCCRTHLRKDFREPLYGSNDYCLFRVRSRFQEHVDTTPARRKETPVEGP
jgi:hypothetical protein